LADKVPAVGRRDYLDDLSYEKLRPVIDEFGLAIPTQTVDGQVSSSSARSPIQRLRILNLVDDDYLASSMTDHKCPVSDLFGYAGRQLLDRLAIPDPWRRNVDAGLELIDDLELQIARLTCELKRQGADHRYIPLLVTAPGFGWINAFTVASEIGDIERFPSPAKLCGYTDLRACSSRALPIGAAQSPSTARAICGGACSRRR
jgi:hypothetical protein